VISKEEVISKIKEYHSDFKIDFNAENPIEVLEYTKGDRIKEIRFGNLNLSGVEVRNIFGLKSARFNVSIEGDFIKFDVIGYGHGVGLSQTGADSMAKNGSGYEEIIDHFYKDVKILDI